MDRDLPVSVWPDWKIVEKIGEGSFGKVYKAQRAEGDKAFYSAIKIITIPANQGELKSIQSEMPGDQSVKEYFQNLVDDCIQEVSTMEYFRGNSHVVAVEDYKVVEYLDTIGWDIYIRMEYLTSFLEYCQGKQMEEDEVIQLGIDLCKALEYCQKLNIIHRDIKPENIFVSRFGEFKLGDFGIARELERTMSTLSKKGTYSYMAPEMYKGEKYDSRVDIYSLGIMLYKLRNKNRLPFLSLEKQLITYRDKENALTRRMSGEPLPAPVEAGEELTKVILKACAYNRDERYSDAVQFGKALEDLKYAKRAKAEDENQPVRKPAQNSKPVQRLEYSKETEIPEDVKKKVMSHAQNPRPTRASKPSQAARRTQGVKQTQTAVSMTQKKPQKSSAQQGLREQVQNSGGSSSFQAQRTQLMRKKKKQTDTKGLMIAVIIMAIAMVILTGIFLNLLLRDKDADTNIEDSGVSSGVLYGTNVDESEKEGLAEDLSVIREHATTIVNELDTYNWIGTEKEGKISYLDTMGEVRKVLIFPDRSEDTRYEEYYYWDGELFFAYIWKDSSIDSNLKDGEVRANYYYYKDGELIRWIDEDNICHDYETDNEKYNELGEIYWKRSIEYTAEFVRTNGEVQDAVSD